MPIMTDTRKTLSLDEIEALEHIFLGPTWATDSDGHWLLPERTLGWEIAAWCTTYLNGIDSDHWEFTLEQLRFLLWWYAVDEDGRFVYRTGVLQRMKGWGKDPLLAVISLVEFVGPSRPVLVNDELQYHTEGLHEGQPLAASHPTAWVQITAVSQEQTVNTMSMFPILMSEQLIAAYGIKAGAELMRADNGRKRLQAVTSSYRAIEGKRTTFTLMNETHHWVLGNGGHKMADTIDGNATKMKSRYLAITNAYLPGEDSVAERMRDSWQAVEDGRAHDIRMLYDSIEAHPLTPLTPDALRVVLPKIIGDALWLDIEDIILSVLDTRIKPSRSRRMYLNQIVAEEDALYGPENWKPLGDKRLKLLEGDEITLGFDGGKSDDATGLVAIRLKDRAAFVLCIEERPVGWPTGEGAPRWEVNREKVDSAVHHAFRTYKVKAFYADVALWESYIDDWAAQYREVLAIKASGKHAIAWDMRQSIQRVTRAHERLMRAIFDGKLKHNENPDLRRHVLNARRRENSYGVSFGKETRESPRKVDLYAALMLAHEAMHDYRTQGKVEKQRTGNGWFL